MQHDDPQQSQLSEEEEFGADLETIRQPKIDLGPDWERDDDALDTQDVRLEDPDLYIALHGEPHWVIREEFEEEELGLIKTGKEANVTLMRRTSGARSCLVAHKTYRPRAERAFRREEDYRDGQSFGDQRVDRAVKKRSGYGRSVLEYAWAYREFPLMRAAWDAGVRVPFPVEENGEVLVMEYIGDVERAAPRLAEVRLDPGEAQFVYRDIVEMMRRLMDIYMVHGDLSPYNILYWDAKPWIIDFPQAVDIARSSRGLEFLRRDCENVCRWARKQGVATAGADLFEELLETAPFRTPL